MAQSKSFHLLKDVLPAYTIETFACFNQMDFAFKTVLSAAKKKEVAVSRRSTLSRRG